MAKSKFWNGSAWEVLGTDADKITETTDHKVMTAAERTKLSGIAAGAQVNVPTNINEGTRTATTVSITSSTGAGARLNAATTSFAGVMTSADKTKLDDIEPGATADQTAAEVPIADTGTLYDATNVEAALAEVMGDLVTHKEDYVTQRQQDQLKVATVEKGLNDYKSTLANVNVNQEAKQEVTGYGTISLPKNTANGQISTSIKGSNVVQVAPYRIEKWRRCNLSDDGTVLAYYGDANYKEDGSNGQVMVEIHKGYVRTEFLNNERRDYVSEFPTVGFETDPAFIRNGVVKDKIYISAFEGSIFDTSDSTYLLNDEQVADFAVGTGDKLCSRAGVKPCSGQTQNLTLPNSRILAQNRGIGWELQDFWTVSFIQMCMFIEHNTFNSQSAIGQGVVNINDATAGNTLNNSVITGLTSSLGNSTGQVEYTYIYPNDSTIKTYPISYHGIENFWGNIWKWVDGININNNVPYVADYNFISNKFDGHYKLLGVTLSNTGGYVEDWADFKYGFLPSKVGTNKIGDYYYQASGARVARLGGYWNLDSDAGAGCWLLSTSSAYRSRGLGARLLYLPK